MAGGARGSRRRAAIFWATLVALLTVCAILDAGRALTFALIAGYAIGWVLADDCRP